MKCTICAENVERDPAGRWRHKHSGDCECWTGDGATATPPADCPKCLQASAWHVGGECPPPL
jgi:endogenous inhibitor of DNA gyrase (YacG/DUF329 family)